MATPKFSKFTRPQAGRPGQITGRDLDILDNEFHINPDNF